LNQSIILLLLASYFFLRRPQCFSSVTLDGRPHSSLNNVLVCRQVLIEPLFARENPLTDYASRVAQVNLQVIMAGRARVVRFIAHTAMEPPKTFQNLIIWHCCGGNPS